MQITRRYTVEGQDPFAAFRFVPRTSRIVNPDGSVVFEMKDLLAPGALVAGGRGHPGAEILPPGRACRPRRERVAEAGRAASGCSAAGRRRGDPCTGQETDARQVFRRLAGCWTYWGWKGGYFSSEADARAFFDETCHMLAGADGGAELAAVVQHRPALGLRHRGPAAGPLPRRSRRPARWSAPRRPTSARRRMPASSSRSATTW